MERPEWAPEGVNADRASAARIYDYLLGGSHNFAADREVARMAIAAMPDVPVQAKANRAFLHRAVRYLVGAGVHQFLDLGSGIPTLGNVHEIAQKMVPETRVVYVDIDPVAVAQSRHLLAANDRTGVVLGDLRDPKGILASPDLQRLLDPNEPIAILLVAVLHAIPDQDDPFQIVADYRDVLAPGSYLAIAHGTNESRAEETERLAQISRQTTTPLSIRSRAEIAQFFTGWELVPPGLTWVPLWRPESRAAITEPERSANLAGVGRKP